MSGGTRPGDVTVEREGAHVAVVCTHRPPNNYFDAAVVAGVASAYEELAASDWCRAIVLAAEGKHFCAGLDFAANADQKVGALYGDVSRSRSRAHGSMSSRLRQ